MDIQKYLSQYLLDDPKEVELLTEYFNRLQFDLSNNDLGEMQLIQLFLDITKDFYDGKIDAETMCHLFEIVYPLLRGNKYLESTPVGHIMFDASEYDWYIHHDPEDAVHFLKKVKRLRRLYLKS
jgi:hypothetical protein